MTAVTGTYRDAAGEPSHGYIRFTLHPAAMSSDGEQVTCAPVYGILDSAGYLNIDLIPDSDLVVDGTAVYEVAEFIDDCRRTWWLILTDDTLVDLPSRFPGDTVGDVAILPVAGPRGPQGLVAVDSTLTGPPGSEALVEDLDPADTSARLRFTIPQGQPGQDGADGEVQNADVWAPGTEALRPLVTAYQPITGRLVVGGVEMGDTGNRDITALVINGWSATRLYVRRIGSTVRYWGYGIDATAATSDQVFSPISGFNLFMWGVDGVVGNANGVLRVAKYGGGLSASAAVWASDRTVLDYMGTTNQSWPTSLPGTPA